MAFSQQKLHTLEVANLKNLKNLEISFDDSPVTAILGPNGNGKSTILHALACAFEPNNDGENHKFSNFFLPSTDALWDGSEMKITHSYREGANVHSCIVREYSKRADRWKPRYSNRPKRDVYYIGIDQCVPMIEAEKKQAKINYSTEEVNESIITTILEKASLVLNRRYTAYNIHTASNKQFIGVEVDGLRYSALSMSAGEQKVFSILEKVYRANKYSLILIDELDLLLHDEALKKLVKVIHERATLENIQIVFTTHRESILELEAIINIRHIISKNNRSLCFSETKPDAINRLTGVQPRPLEIFVEDDLASAIVKKIAGKLRMAKYVSIQRYGAAINCFTTVGGLLLSGENCESSLFVLDGDVFRSDEEQQVRMNKVITGHDQHALTSKATALDRIKQFILPENEKPEKYIHSLICDLEHSDNEEFNEIIDVANEIIVTDDSHKYIDDIIDRLGWDKSTGLSKIIDILSTSDTWSQYVEPIHSWLEAKASSILEHQN
ncbi:AAA family ATPase [Endozoicomonas ascidiicola]|uniref:AAA family ATPase n=1 Tax=Endozoicomonas ascidiicola TaxID=1698521 RepID=UPI00082B0711|nr:AAA family ATPase [Endozoicomonas ascidiicola]